MVKKKKLHRWCAGFFAAALLLVCLAPVLTVGADAAVIESWSNGVLSYETPVIYRLGLPLDIMYSEIAGLVIDNPLLSYGKDNATSYGFNIEMPSILYSENYAGDYLGFWHFEYGDTRVLTDNAMVVGYGVQIDSLSSSNVFGFTNSQPFVVSFAQLYNFLSYVEFVLQPGFSLAATVEADIKFPRPKSDGGWELESFHLEYSEQSNNPYDHISECSAFLNLGADYFPSFLLQRDVIVDSINIRFDYWNPPDGIGDSIPASLVDFGFLYFDSDSLVTFEEFYIRYPSSVTNVVTPPGTTPPETTNPGSTSDAFKLVEALSAGIGTFLDTEIVPGISFGGLLAVAVGISLVYVFIKHLGD